MMTPTMMKKREEELNSAVEETTRAIPKLSRVFSIQFIVILCTYAIGSGLIFILLIFPLLKEGRLIADYRSYAESVAPGAIGVYANTGTEQDTDWFVLHKTGEVTLVTIDADSDTWTHTVEELPHDNPAVMSVVNDSIKR